MLARLHSAKIVSLVPRLNCFGGTIKIGKKELPIYTLMWKPVDQAKTIDFLNWSASFSQRLVNRTNKVPATLPLLYNHKIIEMQYAIPRSYLRDINHYSQLFLMEWGRANPHDTVIREMSLGVAVTAINVALKLVADCAIVEGHWLRNDFCIDKLLLKHLLMYKFWSGFTGRGVVGYHAELPELKERLVTLETTKLQAEQMGNNRASIDRIKLFLNEIEAIEKETNDCYLMKEDGPWNEVHHSA